MPDAVVYVLILGLIAIAAAIFSSRKNRDCGDLSSGEGEGIAPRKQAKPFNPATARRETKSLSGTASIIDGDTLVIRKTQIRLFGIDAPEIEHPFGNKAKWALIGLCKGQSVRAEVCATDVHGRCFARCYLEDGRDLSAEMVKIGLAIDWPKFSGGKYRDLEADNARRKMWLADARQKGRMHVWERYEARPRSR